MTHSGGKTHAIGDRGQRYEVSFFNPATGQRQSLGWSETAEGAQSMAESVEAHPSWEYPWITDRQAKAIIPNLTDSPGGVDSSIYHSRGDRSWGLSRFYWESFLCFQSALDLR